MSIITRWYSVTDWETWNHDVADHNFRIVNGKIKLPYLSINHIGTGSQGSDYDSDTVPPTLVVPGEVKIRYRFGQFYTSGNTAMENRMGIETPSQSGTKLYYANVPRKPEITEYGFLCPTRGAFAVVGTDSDFLYPQGGTKFYVGCWIKSLISDYSNRVGYIIISLPGYSIYIDTDNKIKAEVSGLILNSNITIDTDWHWIMLVSDVPGDVNAHHYLIIDNEIVDEVIGNTSAPVANVFSLGSNEINHPEGFMGYIDEFVLSEWSGLFSLVKNYRFAPLIIRSPVVDSENERNEIAQIWSIFDAPLTSSVTFSFRTSDSIFNQDDLTINWSGFTFPNQIQNNHTTDTSEIRLSLKGRYHQARIRLLPSIDELKSETPEIEFLQLTYITQTQLLQPSNPAYDKGKILGQIINFPESKHIDKISLNLTVNRSRPTDVIIGKDGVASFQAAVWKNDREAIVFQPAIHFGTIEWNTNGTPIVNSRQMKSYSGNAIVDESPYLEYEIDFLESGVYDLWGYGYCELDNSLYWCFDGDTTDIRACRLGQNISGFVGIPYWNKFGVFEVFEAGTIHTFRVYLGINSEVVLDQWYLTKNTQLEEELSSLSDAYTTPLPLSSTPFNTALRVRSLTGGTVVPIENFPRFSGDVNVTMWLPSKNINASGQFNYELPDGGNDFSDGLSLEYWQVCGTNEHYASWDYKFIENSIGDTFFSKDFGETIIFKGP